MDNASIWWLVAGALVGAELLTGTFYLLMLAVGAVVAALAAHLGSPLTGQLVAAALVGGLAVTLWRFYRLRQTPPALDADPTQHLDAGESVQVDAWDAQGTAQVRHRGATWTAVLAPGQSPVPGLYRIQTVTGNRLVLEKH